MHNNTLRASARRASASRCCLRTTVICAASTTRSSASKCSRPLACNFYDEYFGACDRLLKPDGMMVLQTITMNEQKFPVYRKRCDWIQKYIFPGSELASVAEIGKSLGRCTRMSFFHLEDIGLHYAETLKQWRERFMLHLDEVKAQGFDDRFVRMWEYYLCYCEGAFRERHIGDVQLVLTKQRAAVQLRSCDQYSVTSPVRSSN